jgi:hypothetical protein
MREIAELRPGPHQFIVLPGEPFGKEAAEFIDATLRSRRHESRRPYGVATRVISWDLHETPSQKVMADRFHILPSEGAVIIEGIYAPSYPVASGNYGSSGKLLFEKIVAEQQSGTITIEYQSELHGQPTIQKLDITSYGQLHLHGHNSDEGDIQKPPDSQNSFVEDQSVVDPGYDSSGKEIIP